MPDAPALLARDQAILADLAAGMSVRGVCKKHHVSPRNVTALRKALDVRGAFQGNGVSADPGNDGNTETVSYGRAPALPNTPAARAQDLAGRVATAIGGNLATVASIAAYLKDRVEQDPGADDQSIAYLAALVHAQERLADTAIRLLAIVEPDD